MLHKGTNCWTASSLRNGRVTSAVRADLIAGIRGDKDLSRVFGNVEVIVGEQLRDVGAATKYEEKATGEPTEPTAA